MSGMHANTGSGGGLPLVPAASAAQGGVVQRLDPRVKIVAFIGFSVVVVSTPARVFWAFAAYAAILATVAGMARLRTGYLFKRALVVLPFVLVVAVFLPFFPRAGTGASWEGGFVSPAGLLVLWNVTAKAILGSLSMILLVSTTQFADLADGFTRLRVPQIFVMIVSFMYRYTFVFVDEVRRMHRAMVSRNYRGRWIWNVPTLGHMIGALFLRSYHRGERVYVAMISRGYEGSLAGSSGRRLRVADMTFAGLLLGGVVAVRVIAGVSAG